MNMEDRLEKLFEQYATAIQTGTESQALDLRKKIRQELEKIEKK